jgi:hypothetical protein
MIANTSPSFRSGMGLSRALTLVSSAGQSWHFFFTHSVFFCRIFS